MTDKGLLVMILVFLISILGVFFILNGGASKAKQDIQLEAMEE